MHKIIARRLAATTGLLAVLAAGVVVSDAHAITGQAAIGPAGPGVIVRTANSAQFVYGGTPLPSIARAYANVGSAGAIAAIDTVSSSSIPGTPSINVTRVASKSAISVAGGAVLKTLPIVGVGIAIWDIYDSMRVRPDGSGGIVHDPGAVPVEEQSFCWKYSTVPTCSGSAAGACAAMTTVQDPFTYQFVFKEMIDETNANCSGRSINNYTGVDSNIGDYRVSRIDTVVPVCPASIDAFDPAQSIPKGQPPGPDGKCRQARGYWQPIEPSAVPSLLPQFPSVQFTPDVVRDIVGRGGEIEPSGAPEVSGPLSAPGTPKSTTTTGPDGVTQTTVQNTVNNYTYQGDTITWNISNTTTTTGPGGTTTTTTDGVEVDVCGLPGKPACKIDETGTPEAPQADSTWWDGVLRPLKEFAQNPAAALPSLPSINWAFEFPTGCAVIPTPAFSPWLTGVDICEYQPMFHEIMSVVWVLGALFGAIQMFFRNALSYA